MKDAPLRFGDGGVVRVGSSRVTLDLIVEEYESGLTPEDIVRGYDTLSLADVHGSMIRGLRRRLPKIDLVRVQDTLRRRHRDQVDVDENPEHPTSQAIPR